MPGTDYRMRENNMIIGVASSQAARQMRTDPPRQTYRMKERPPKDRGQASASVLMSRPPASIGAEAKMGPDFVE